ncbi:MAG: GNAT family N-acetyltransferase [Chloroflexota bacterium]
MDRTTSDVQIRPMVAADVAPASEVIVDGGWSDRTAFFEWAVGHPTCIPLVADDAGRIVGTGVATANGSVGWVGAIFVATDRRRTGLGSALSRAVLDELEARGCTTQVLIATDEGRPIYERLGFEVQTRYVLQIAPEAAPAADDGAVRPYAPADFDAINDLDHRATGEDRSAILRAFASPETGRVAVREDGTVGAFVVRAPWGGRALIASEPALALALLEARRRTASDPRITIGVLLENEVGRAALMAAGWTERRGGPRLVRGAPLDWRPDWIYGQFTGAIG